MESVMLRMRYIHSYSFIQLFHSCFIQLYDYSHSILCTADNAYASLANRIIRKMQIIAHLYIHRGSCSSCSYCPSIRRGCSAATSEHRSTRWSATLSIHLSRIMAAIELPPSSSEQSKSNVKGIANVIVNAFVQVCCKYLQNIHIK